jgi:hypothetical protein
LQDDAVALDTQNGIDHRRQHIFASQLFAKESEAQLADAKNKEGSDSSSEPAAVHAKLNEQTIRR